MSVLAQAGDLTGAAVGLHRKNETADVFRQAGLGTAKPQYAGGFQDTLNRSIRGTAVSMDAIFEEAGAYYDISPRLLRAVAKAESNFNPKVVSRAGAVGVMQLMPGTARSLGVTDPYDPRQNIMGGAKYLKQNLDRFGGNVPLALAAYNAGPGSVQKYGGIPPYKETQNYVRKIMADLAGTDGLSSGNMVVCSSEESGSLSVNREYDGMSWLAAARLTGDLSPSGFSSSSFSNGRYSLPFYSMVSREDMDGESWSNLVQIVRLQMMMDMGKDHGMLI